jgi:hypothetical protein
LENTEENCRRVTYYRCSGLLEAEPNFDKGNGGNNVK